MKKLTLALLASAALSTAAFAETPTEKQLHSFDFVSTVASHQEATPETYSAPSHEGTAEHAGKHHGKHHHGKHAHKHEGKKDGKKDGKPHHHHHHKKADAAKKDAAPAPKQQ